MEILLYFVAYLIIAILCAVLFNLCGLEDDNLTTFLAIIWPLLIPIIIIIIIIIPIKFVLRKLK